MFSKIIALFMSAIMSVTGLSFGSLETVLDSLSQTLIGVPLSEKSVKSDFFGKMSVEDIVEIDSDTAYVKDKLVVFLKPDLSYFEKVSFFMDCGGRLAGWCAPVDMYVLNWNADDYDDIEAKCESLNAEPCVEIAVPAFASKVAPQLTPDDPFEDENDPDFGYQAEPDVIWDESSPKGRNWWLEVIDARQAWNYEEFFNPVKVGILDAGFDTEHEELAGKISFPNSKQERRNLPDDHGTHVAGIIAAERNNGVGLAGVCDHAELICADWSPDGLFQFWLVDLAILFAFNDVVSAGAKVINLSLGVSASVSDNDAGFIGGVLLPKLSSLIMASLLEDGYDFLVVQAAGNGNARGEPIDVLQNGNFCSLSEDNIYVGSHDVSTDDILNRIVRVASVGGYNGRNQYYISTFSNVGESVDIAAPGEDIYSTTYSYDYSYMSGTSMAAPIVTGVAALVWSVNPSLTGDKVKEIICTSTDSRAYALDGMNYGYGLPDPDYPIVNAGLAVEKALAEKGVEFGTVAGKVDGDGYTVKFDGEELAVDAQGYFFKAASVGEHTVTVFAPDGTVSYETVINVENGNSYTVNELIYL